MRPLFSDMPKGQRNLLKALTERISLLFLASTQRSPCLWQNGLKINVGRFFTRNCSPEPPDSRTSEQPVQVHRDLGHLPHRQAPIRGARWRGSSQKKDPDPAGTFHSLHTSFIQRTKELIFLFLLVHEAYRQPALCLWHHWVETNNRAKTTQGEPVLWSWALTCLIQWTAAVLSLRWRNYNTSWGKT